MKRKGSKLEFISWINRDGSGTSKIGLEYLKLLQDETFTLICLSISENTFIASSFNCFVVKLKTK